MFKFKGLNDRKKLFEPLNKKKKYINGTWIYKKVYKPVALNVSNLICDWVASMNNFRAWNWIPVDLEQIAKYLEELKFLLISKNNFHDKIWI